MSSSFPNGTILAVSTVFGAPKPITALTSANPAVATSTAHGLTNGVAGLLSSGWPQANDRVFRVANQATNSFDLDAFDASDVAKYPTGQGIGSFLPVTTWVNLSQVREMSKSGGEQQFFQWQYLEDASGTQRQRPTSKNAKSINVTLDYDPALAWYAALDKADGDKTLIVLRATLPAGAVLYYGVYPSFDADPSLDMNENMTNKATFSQNSRFTRY